MNSPTPSCFRRRAIALLILIGSLGGAATLNAQVLLSFSGGNGTEVKVTWLSPITYTLTGTTLNSGVNPYFVFQSVTNSQNIFSVQGTPAAGAPSYTSTGAGATDGTQTINNFYAITTAHNDVAVGDIQFRATTDTANTFLTNGDVFTLTAGSLSYTGSPQTSKTYLGALPANGLYNTFIVDAADMRLGNGVSAIPEPSTYAAIAGAAMLGLAVWKRRRPTALVTTPANPNAA